MFLKLKPSNPYLKPWMLFDGADPDKDAGGTSDADNTGTGDKSKEKVYTKDQVEAIVQERLGKAAKSWESKTKKEQEDADRIKAEKDGDLQKQLEMASTELTTLRELKEQHEALLERVAELEKVLDEFYQSELSQLPEEAQQILKSLPGDPPVEARVKWLVDNKSKFGTAIKAQGAPPPTPPATGENNGSKAKSKEVDGERRQTERRRVGRMF